MEDIKNDETFQEELNGDVETAENTDEVLQEENTDLPDENMQETDAITDGDCTEGEDKDSKKSKKSRKKDKRDEEIADLKERLQRNLAEFDNFRKRTEREKSQMFDMGAKTMIEKLLPVIDNLERGIGTLDEESSKEPFAAGIIQTYKQLTKVLEEVGVEPIEALGNEFNPDLHNAVMHVEDENFGENIVCEDFLKGYLYKGTVVRHSMVKVAN